jgi:dynein heavy chain
MEVAGQREKYRVLRENVLLVVRDYNKVRDARGKRPGRLEEG